MLIELSNWEKLYVLIWKNFCVSLKRHKRLLLSIVVPPLFCMVLVFLRCLIETQNNPAKKFRELSTKVLWDNLLNEIENRRTRLQEHFPNFTHNTYVPQKILAFAPNWPISKRIMNVAINDLSGLELKEFDNCTKMRDAMFKEHYFAGVCFKNRNETTTKNTAKYLEYEIVFPSELRIYNDSYIGASWNTNQLFDLYNSNEKRQQSSHDGGYVGYIREGFAAIQESVAMSYIRIWSPNQTILAPKVRRFPLHAYVNDPLIRRIQISISLILVCGFLFPIANATNMMIKEKETHVRKCLKSMDVDNWIDFLAWFMITFTCMAISSIIIVAILKIEWNDGRAILHSSSALAVLFLLLAFNMASTSFSIMMSSMFAEASTGVPLTCIIWLASYLPYIAASMNASTIDLQLLVCCFSNTVLGFLMKDVVEIEKLGDGFDFHDYGNLIRVDTKLSPGAYCGILFALSVVYILIALYLEEVNPGLHDIPKAWNFIFRPRDQRERASFRRAQAIHTRQTRVFEIEPEYRKIALKIEGLTKIYNGVAVVKNVTLNLYEGDITVIVGHNGAGKTTLLQMIAGMVLPSKGKVSVQGLDANRHKNVTRKRIGTCLQDGLLFPELNIADQLTLFGRLRGHIGIDLDKDVQKYLDAMRLSHRRSDATDLLSNGEQKFLAVCCALVGNCKIVLLDDPSKGLDAFARKSLWELLRNERKMRTILIATHSEEETEALGDRVAVLSGGELKCFGSTFFLKKIYGQGHRLICYKGKEFVTSTLTDIIQKYVPNITPECELGAQVSYILEDVRAHTELFDELEERSAELGIQGITIAEVDSGDIFLRMGAEDPSEGDRARQIDIMNGQSIYTREYERLRFMEKSERLTGFRLILNHCEVMQIKRLLSCLRLTLLGILQLIMPILFTIVSFSLMNYQHQRIPLHPMQLRLISYPESITVYHTRRDIINAESANIYSAYAEQLFWLGAPHRSEEVPAGEQLIGYLLEKQKQLADRTNNKYLIGVSIGDDKILAYFNNYPLHTLPISLNVIYTAMFRGIVDSTGKISSHTYPLKFSSDHRIVLKNVPASIGNYLAINISFCAGFTWSLCIIYLIRERKENFKLLQFLSGVRGHVFWINNFIFDFFTIVVSSLIVLLTVVLFELDVFMDENTSGAYFLVLIFAGTCMCSANYLVSVISSNPVDGYIGITIFNIFGTMCYWNYLETLNRGYRLEEKTDSYEVIARLLPHFSLCNALVKIFHKAELEIVCKNKETHMMSKYLEHCKVEPNCCRDFSVWAYKGGVLPDLMYIFIYGIICWILLYLNETYSYWRQLLGITIPEDNDNDSNQNDDEREYKYEESVHPTIINEELTVFETRKSMYRDQSVVLNRVCFRKHYEDIVNRLTFRVKNSECFVLLGPNACGKSTLIKILVGRLAMTHGNAYVQGLSVNEASLSELYKCTGYCPQDNLCLSEYTIAEVMRMVSLLRGLNNHDVVDTCDNLAKVLGFHKHVYKKLSICTPGIKRRFYCACALIGNPKLILLDEATSCVDIAGRRQLWNIICKLKERNHSIIFTSVVTQDCETIADRVAIMLSGRITLISDPWTLNQDYALGFLLKMKVKRIIVRVPDTTEDWVLPSYRTFSANPFLKLATFIENEFPMSKVKDQLGNIVVYFIPEHTTTISHIFEVMQRNAFILYVEDFLITRSALSVMFLETIEEERYRQLQLLQ